jgi:hypothetical protein
LSVCVEFGVAERDLPSEFLKGGSGTGANSNSYRLAVMDALESVLEHRNAHPFQGQQHTDNVRSFWRAFVRSCSSWWLSDCSTMVRPAPYSEEQEPAQKRICIGIDSLTTGTQAAAPAAAATEPCEPPAAMHLTPAQPICTQHQAEPQLPDVQDEGVQAVVPSCVSECASSEPAARSGENNAVLSPSKRCVAEGAQTLIKAFSDSFEVLLDPNTASPDRRQLHALLCQIASRIKNKIKYFKLGATGSVIS